jgi:uncharacterized membrane protein YfcA
MSIAALLFDVLLGAVIGFWGAFGVGGGIIAIPVLALIFGFSQQVTRHRDGMIVPNVLLVCGATTNAEGWTCATR